MDYFSRQLRAVTYHSYKCWPGTPALWEPAITITLKPCVMKNQRQRSEAGHTKKHQARANHNTTVEARRALRTQNRLSGEFRGSADASMEVEAQPALKDRPSDESKGKGKRPRSQNRIPRQARQIPRPPWKRKRQAWQLASSCQQGLPERQVVDPYILVNTVSAVTVCQNKEHNGTDNVFTLFHYSTCCATCTCIHTQHPKMCGKNL